MSAKRFAQSCAQVVVLLIVLMPMANAQLKASFGQFKYDVNDSFGKFKYESRARSLTGPQGQAAVNAPRFQLNTIRQHLDQLRLLSSVTVADALQVGFNGQVLPSGDAPSATSNGAARERQTGGAASADTPDSFQRWGGFINGDVENSRQSTFETQPGFRTHTDGITVGADYRLPGNHVLGAAVSFVKATADLDQAPGDQTAKGYGFSVFGSYVPTENAYIDGTLNLGHNRYDSQRMQATGDFATSNTHGNQLGLAVSAGYAFNRGPLALTPYGRVEYIDAKVNGFTESGSQNEAMTISDQRIKLTILSIGGQASYALSTKWGVLMPNARIEFQHVAQRDVKSVTAQIASDLTTLGGIPVLGQDRDFGSYAVGFSAIFPKGVSAFFNYEQFFSKESFSDRRYTLGARIEF